LIQTARLVGQFWRLRLRTINVNDLVASEIEMGGSGKRKFALVSFEERDIETGGSTRPKQ